MDAFVGEWNVSGTMPLDEPIEVTGRTTFEWLDRGGFLLERSTIDREEFPNSISVIGLATEGPGYLMHYFDSRGVSRVYAMHIEGRSWRLERAPSGPDSDFWQRWIGEFSDDGNMMKGRWENSNDGANWTLDFHLTYTRT